MGNICSTMASATGCRAVPPSFPFSDLAVCSIVSLPFSLTAHWNQLCPAWGSSGLSSQQLHLGTGTQDSGKSCSPSICSVPSNALCLCDAQVWAGRAGRALTPQTHSQLPSGKNSSEVSLGLRFLFPLSILDIEMRQTAFKTRQTLKHVIQAAEDSFNWDQPVFQRQQCGPMLLDRNWQLRQKALPRVMHKAD